MACGSWHDVLMPYGLCLSHSLQFMRHEEERETIQ
jgi:hypothetical protein